MLRYLADAANAITALGLLCSSASLYLALSGRPELAVAVALWAMLADRLDGVVASRTRDRPVDTAKMGKSLDGFADLVYGAVVPAVVLIQISGGSYLSLVAGTMLLIAGALRLSYFSNFGPSSDGRFTGVPLSYDVPLLAVLFLLRPRFSLEGFPLVANAAFLVLATLHVASIRIPATSGAMYVVLTVFSIAASSLLAMRGQS